jgi:hypothetical protein
MKDKYRNFLSSCEETDFGRIAFSAAEKAFYRRFNSEVISFCGSLPESVQSDSLFFLLEYSGTRWADGVDFFANFYGPSWSILYWLSRPCAFPANRYSKGDVACAVRAHAMALLLHSLDDHLIDGQVPVTPLSLLLRSQLWMIMNNAFRALADGVPGGAGIVGRFLEAYCWSLQPARKVKDIQTYCKRFKMQMAIGMVAPVLLTLKLTGNADFGRDMEAAYGSFGTSWRLLDDIRDLASDMDAGVHSSIYLCLPRKLRKEWDRVKVDPPKGGKKTGSPIADFLMERGILETMKAEAYKELEAAASIAESRDLTGLADELRWLARPLRESGA